MTRVFAIFCAACLAAPLAAQDNRQLDAHEHGVGQLDIAIDGSAVAMHLRAPGADIVGFEYAAQSAQDRAAIDAAVAVLARPLDLFVFPAPAGCSVVRASAELESKGEHEDHHEDHATEADAEHGHDEHAHDDHDEHGHDKNAEADHENHAESEAERHTEFHAEYLLDCANPEALSEILFAYFDDFANAIELDVQVVSERGAAAHEVDRDAPRLDLGGMF